MRKILFIIALLTSVIARSQVSLSISPYTFTLYDSSVVAGTLDSADIQVINTSALSFTNDLYIYIAVQDTLATTYHTVDSILFPLSTIAANDSISLRLFQTLNVSAGQYYYDINVIVIWPVAVGVSSVDSLNFPIFVELPIGINEIDLNTMIYAYPNPSTEYFSIENKTISPIEEVRIMDSSGKLISILGNQSKIDTQKWKAGVYIITVVFENKQSRTLRVVKRK